MKKPQWNHKPVKYDPATNPQDMSEIASEKAAERALVAAGTRAYLAGGGIIEKIEHNPAIPVNWVRVGA